MEILVEKSSNHDISPEDRIFITSIFDAIGRLDVVNLDLLSITPLRKWPKLLSSRLMGRIIQGLKSNMKLRKYNKDNEYKSVQEWSQKS